MALVICWDFGSREAVRETALKSAKLILVPAGWRHPWGAQYELACSTRALDNTVYLARANQPGVYPEDSFDTPGGVYGPDGDRICRSVGAGGVAEVDVELHERWRSSFSSTLPARAGTLAPQPLL